MKFPETSTGFRGYSMARHFFSRRLYKGEHGLTLLSVELEVLKEQDVELCRFYC